MAEEPIVIVSGDDVHYHMPVPEWLGKEFDACVWPNHWTTFCNELGTVYNLGGLLKDRKACTRCYPKLRECRHGNLVDDLLDRLGSPDRVR